MRSVIGRVEPCSSRSIETETRVVGRIAEHEDQLFTPLLEQSYSATHQRAAGAKPLYIRHDRKRRKRDRSQAQACALDPKPGESDIAFDSDVRSFRHQRKHELTIGPQAVDQIGLGRAAKSARQHGAHWRGVGMLLESHVER